MPEHIALTKLKKTRPSDSFFVFGIVQIFKNLIFIIDFQIVLGCVGLFFGSGTSGGFRGGFCLPLGARALLGSRLRGARARGPRRAGFFC